MMNLGPFSHFFTLTRSRATAITRPVISVSVPGMNISRPPAMNTMRSSQLSFHSSQPWKPADMMATPMIALMATEMISPTLPCIIIAGL